MDKRNVKLPKEGLVEPESRSNQLIDDSDVEGHGLPLTAPPSIGPSHGGENIPSPIDDEDDVTGHKRH